MLISDPGPVRDPLGAEFAGRVWFVLAVTDGGEPDACADLAARGGAGVVAWSRCRVRRGRHRVVYSDVWRNGAPGYLFAALDCAGSAAWASRVRGVRHVLGIGDRPSAVDPREIARFLTAATGARPTRRRAAPGAPPIAAGDLVEVIGGPFDGVQARVEAVQGGLAVLPLSFFGTVRAVKIYVDALAKVGA
jgi:transcription antitermination factor NusG